MEAYIYTYVNKETGKTYIGSRSAYKGSCYDDFNIKYFSSSKDKEFRQDMADGKLEGQIVLVMNDENANKKIIDVESKMITAYWNKYGRENSYNHHNNDGSFSTAGISKVGNPSYKKSETHKHKLSLSNQGKTHNLSVEGRNVLRNNGKNTKHNNFEGHKHTNESKQKIGQSVTGDKNGMYAKQHSLGSKQKMSESHKGRHRVYDNKEHTKWHME